MTENCTPSSVLKISPGANRRTPTTWSTQFRFARWGVFQQPAKIDIDGDRRQGTASRRPSSRSRRGASLFEIVTVIGITSLVLSTTSMAVIRISQLNFRFKSIGVEQRNRHRTFEALRRKIHQADTAKLLSPQRVSLSAEHWPQPDVLDLKQLPSLANWNWEAPTRWSIQASRLQVVADHPGAPEVLFAAAIGITAPRTLGINVPAQPAPHATSPQAESDLLPPIESPMERREPRLPPLESIEVVP